MASKTPNRFPRRVGLRAVAKAAGVCLMTASLSLRDSPVISAPTRARVRQIAEKLGYRPDPEIARLMGRLRASRVIKRSVVIAVLDLQQDARGGDHPYVVRLRQGIERRLDVLGFGIAPLRLREYGGDAAAMMRVIRSRGITGCILLPSNVPVKLSPSLKWDGLSVVAATTSVQTPRFHRVVPNQVFNTMSLIADMARRGYTKIGAILSESLEQRTAHAHSLALTWHGHRSRILLLPDDSTPAESANRIATWLRRHQVDVIFAQDAEIVAHALRSAKPGRGDNQVGLVSLSTIGDQGIAYQDEQPEYIGESAVSLLAGMMHNNETGIPEHPRVTTVDGVFCDAPTVRPVG